MLMTIFGILILIMALFLVITILMQSSRDHRLSGTIAGGAETFFGKQKGKTMDGVLNKITIVVCVVFFACVLLMYIFQGTSGTTSNNTTVIDPSALGDITAGDTTGDNDVNADNTDANTEADAEGETAEDTEGETEGETENDADVNADAEAEADTETENGAAE